ncbi:MAG: hybrid sensor histidine kinase/response regulator [Myxococcota bacterium]
MTRPRMDTPPESPTAHRAAQGHGATEARDDRAELYGLVHELQLRQLELDSQNDDLRHALDEARAARDQYVGLYEHAPVGCMVLDASGVIVEANVQAAVILGIERDALPGRKLGQLVAEEQRPAVVDLPRRAAETKRTESCQATIPAAAGLPRQVQLWAAAADQGARLRVWLLDVTERARQEANLRLTQNAEAVARLAGDFASAFRPVLGGILRASDVVLESLNTPEQARRTMMQIKAAAERGSTLVTKLLDYSGDQTPQAEPLNLNLVALELQRSLRLFRGERVGVETRLEPELGVINADAEMVEQALRTLALRALDALPDAGTITIATDNVLIQRGSTCWSDMEPGQYVTISVTDIGRVLDETTRANRFEPTREGQCDGTRLEMATVHRIVTRNGGRVRLHVEPGRGTSFILYFPAMEEATMRKASEETADGPATILVAEDDVPLCKYLGKVLLQEGYSVLLAKNGTEALRLWQAHQAAIALVLTDIDMPKMSGFELAAKIADRRVDQPIIFMSGDQTKSEYLRPCDRFVTKPFSAARLAATIREMLDGVPAHPPGQPVEAALVGPTGPTPIGGSVSARAPGGCDALER